jgi:SAM-dependent methyltransferase
MNWDARYSEPGYAYGTAPNDFLREMAGRIPPGPVLCLAEGEGRNAVFLAELGHAVTAVDASAVGLAKAATLARARAVGLETVHADLADFAIKEGAWAGIVSVFAHLPPALRTRLHSAVVRGLRPGGVYLLEAYTPQQLAFGTGGPADAQLLMTADALRRELAGLELEICREVERDVVEGRFHSGRAAVVQVLGRRPG